MPVPTDLWQAFTAGDCWHLAHTLAARFQHIAPYALADSGGGWCHMLARDDRTGAYIDINGVQTFDQVQAAWDCEEWTDIIPAAEVADPQPYYRAYPDASVDDAIEYLIADGWTPPPLR